MRRLAVAVASLITVGVLFLAVFPSRALLEQRRARQEARQQVDELVERNRSLDERVQRLRTDREVERLAREQYNLVRPGEEAYAILPSPAAPETAKPRVSAQTRPVRSWWGRLRDRVTSLL